MKTKQVKNTTGLFLVAFTADVSGEVTVPSDMELTLGAGDRIMLWASGEAFTPLCRALTIEQ